MDRDFLRLGRHKMRLFDRECIRFYSWILIGLAAMTGFVAEAHTSYKAFPATTPPATEQENGNYVSQCTIYDRNRKPVWTFSAWNCHFFIDGSFLAGEAESNRLTYYGKDMSVIWTKPIRVHHNVLSSINDEKYILLLTSAIRSTPDHRCRVDKIIKIDAKGTAIREFEPRGKRLLNGKRYFSPEISGAPCEISHYNSVYEIPKNRSRLSAFAAGNIIVNDIHNRLFFILDPELKRILWSMSYSLFGIKHAHDLQVLPDGSLFVYINDDIHKPCSSLVRINPESNVKEWSFSESPRDKFCSEYMGGLQMLPDKSIIYTSNVNGGAKSTFAIKISPEGAEQWREELVSFKGVYVQAFYQKNLFRFLESQGSGHANVH